MFLKYFPHLMLPLEELEDSLCVTVVPPVSPLSGMNYTTCPHCGYQGKDAGEVVGRAVVSFSAQLHWVTVHSCDYCHQTCYTDTGYRPNTGEREMFIIEILDVVWY